MSNKSGTETKKRLAVSVILMAVLTICLCVTTYALVMVSVSMQNNYFKTGKIEINLNDGAPVIEEREFIFEPGMTVDKDFFVENKSTWDVYYKIYFDDVEGGLATVLDIEIKDKASEKVLFSGKMSELSKEAVGAADDSLRINEKRNLVISFHYPEESGNLTQNMNLTFKICAEAVQTKNNDDKLFS